MARTDTDVEEERPEVFPGLQLHKLKEIRPRDYALRFALGAVVSIAAGVIGKSVGPRFGGMFLAFPAILPASLTLIQDKENTRRAGRNAIGAVLGGVGLIAFAMVGEAAFGHAASGLTLALALVVWLAVSGALYALLAVLRPDDCDRGKD